MRSVAQEWYREETVILFSLPKSQHMWYISLTTIFYKYQYKSMFMLLPWLVNNCVNTKYAESTYYDLVTL